MAAAGATVLVVDDHPSFRRCARTLLVAEGFEVVGEAEDGARRVALVAELGPELVLLDIQLPDLDGFEVASRLLARDPGLAIVLVSSRDRGGVRVADREERRARLHRQGELFGRRSRGCSNERDGRGRRAAPERPTGPRACRVRSLLALGAAALAATARRLRDRGQQARAEPGGHAALTVVVCLTFVGTALVALRRPPYVRSGCCSPPSGFASLLGALHDANARGCRTRSASSPRTSSSRCSCTRCSRSRAAGSARGRPRCSSLAAYLDVLALQALAVALRPAHALAQRASRQPRARLLARHAGDRARGARGGARRRCSRSRCCSCSRGVRAPRRRRRGGSSCPCSSAGRSRCSSSPRGLVLAPLSSRAAGDRDRPRRCIASIALPVAFLAPRSLQGRLSRAAVGELLRRAPRGRRRRPTSRTRSGARSATDARARAAATATAATATARPLLPLPAAGAPRRDADPAPGRDGRDARPRPLLLLRPELLDAVGAAAGFALANERASRRCSGPRPSCGGWPRSRRRCGGWRRSSRATRARAGLPGGDGGGVPLLGIPSAVLERFETRPPPPSSASSATSVIGGFEVGDTRPVEPGHRALDRAPHRAVGRVDGYEGFRGEVAAPHARARASVQRWPCRSRSPARRGARWSRRCAASERLPPETERRMSSSPSSSRSALASAQARDELAASRRRIVEAGDAERRRLERNLHDGAQQRLVALSIGAAARRAAGCDEAPDEAEELLAVAADELVEALDRAARAGAGNPSRRARPTAASPRRSRSWRRARRSRSTLDAAAARAAAGAGRGRGVLRRLRGARQRRQARAARARRACAPTARTARVEVEVDDDGAGSADSTAAPACAACATASRRSTAGSASQSAPRRQAPVRARRGCRMRRERGRRDACAR